MKAGLVGHGIAGSLTPAMHEAEGRAQGLAYSYAHFDTAHEPYAGQSLAAILGEAETAGFCGLNVTHPFKVEAADLADELVGAAATLGAVNTLVFRDGRRIGHNTDYAGFRSALSRDLRGAGFGEVLLVGAGGAGAAVALAMIDQGVGHLLLHDAQPGRAETLAGRLLEVRPRASVRATRAGETGSAGLDGVVNATPMGMDSHPGMAIDPARLPTSAWVADIVYFPLETSLLARARMRGHRVMTGAGMAVFQAAGSFRLFTGHTADAARMAAAFDRLQAAKENGQEAPTA